MNSNCEVCGGKFEGSPYIMYVKMRKKRMCEWCCYKHSSVNLHDVKRKAEGERVAKINRRATEE
jgi:hypothetical protein